MDQIREQTRLQNLASAQLQRSKLEGWETSIDAFAGSDPTPEIVVVNSQAVLPVSASSPSIDASSPIDSLPDTLEALDRAVDQLMERGVRPSPRNPMGAPHRNPATLERNRTSSATAPEPDETENRRNDFGEAFASAAAALAPIPPVPTHLIQPLASPDEPSRQRLDQVSLDPAESLLNRDQELGQSQTGIAPDELAADSETSQTSTAAASEKSPRHQEALERIGRTVARQLFENPALLDASSVLLVATGGVRRAMDSTESLGRGIAWHLDRPVQLIAFESHDVSVWNELNEVTPEALALADWKDSARIVRCEQEPRFASLELAIEKGESRRLRPEILRSAARRSRHHEACELWLVDAAETDLCQTLGPICDATVLLIDLPQSRIEICREATQHLREHGARLVGTIVINDFEER